MIRKPFTTYDGKEIFLDDDGVFYTENDTIKARSLAEVKKKLDKLAEPIVALRAGDTYCRISNPEEVRVIKEGNRLRDTKTGRLRERYEHLYLYDAEAERDLKEIFQRYEVLIQKRNEIVDRLKLIQ